jgi:hypothetical protein
MSLQSRPLLQVISTCSLQSVCRRKRTAGLSSCGRSVLLAFIGLLVIVSPGYAQAVRSDPRLQKTTSLLIRPSLMRTSETIRKQGIPAHHAIYITDPEEIRAIIGSLTLRRGPYWACGYDWDLNFFISPKEQVRARIKEDCRMLLYKGTPFVFEGRFARHLRSLFNRLKASPSHYILDAKIPAQTDPEEALTKLREVGHAYVFEDLTNKPVMRVRYTVKIPVPGAKGRYQLMRAAAVTAKVQVRDKLQAFIAKANATGRVENVSEIRGSGSGSYDNTIENTQEVTFHFKTSTSKDEMTNLAVSENVQVVEVRIPEFYFIQILSTEIPSEELTAKLKQQVPLIQDLFPFPSGQRSQR